ncbi:MAG: hypothetical protein HC904_16275 [Blastochloris sp.]|nr:hypothetical protein [Blastochloris sp.]
MHLFHFEGGIHGVAVQADDEGKAWVKLGYYLESHPLMPKRQEWRLKQIFGTLGEGIWSLDFAE